MCLNLSINKDMILKERLTATQTLAVMMVYNSISIRLIVYVKKKIVMEIFVNDGNFVCFVSISIIYRPPCPFSNVKLIIMKANYRR